MTITPPRLVRVSLTILLATTVAIAAVACSTKASAEPSGSPSNTATKTPPADTVPKLDAVTISDAVLFNQGPAARYLTKLNRPQPPVTEDMTAIRDAIDKKLAADSAFAGDFAARMQSGDPAQVQAALEDEAKAYVRPALDDRYGAEKVDEALAAFNDQLAQHQVLQLSAAQEFDQYSGSEFWVQTTVALVAVVAVAVVLVFTAFLKNLPGQDMTQAELVRDITVKDITLGLQLGAQVE